MNRHDLPFYDQEIIRSQEEKYIKELLLSYRNHEVTDELKKEVWDMLQKEKHLGNLTIPFKIATRKDPTNKFPSYIEVILDTKV